MHATNNHSDIIFVKITADRIPVGCLMASDAALLDHRNLIAQWEVRAAQGPHSALTALHYRRSLWSGKHLFSVLCLEHFFFPFSNPLPLLKSSTDF